MRAWLLLILLGSLIALAWVRGWRPPDRYNPWAPLDLRAEPDPFLRYKLRRLAADPPRCRVALQRAGARFTSVDDRHGPGDCGWHDAVRLRGTGVAVLSSPAVMACPLAATLVLFDRDALQPAARSAFQQPVVRIDHVGSYACRNVYHRSDAPLSRHARAQAIDITGFQLADGRQVRIGKAWDDGTPAGRFLHRVRARGCAVAGMLLGPDYNAAHRTHFHIEASGWGYCPGGGWAQRR
jgi:hypothetical protein